MSKTLVKRLREDSWYGDLTNLHGPEAADRIEQLEAERDELAAALRGIFEWSVDHKDALSRAERTLAKLEKDDEN